MSSIQCPSLPIDTAQAAEVLFGKDHPYIKLGDALESVWEELNLSVGGFKDPFLVSCFYPYSLITILQSWESLTDRQMSQAMGSRLDLKYAMHLPLNYPGSDPSMLCEFRQRMLADWTALESLQWMIRILNNLLKREQPAVRASKMVTRICLPNRAEHIFECICTGIEAIAIEDPQWLKAHMLPHWYRRYSLQVDSLKIPIDQTEIQQLIQSVGNDGQYLINEIEKTKAVALKQLPEIQILSDEWQQQFSREQNLLKFRDEHCLSCSIEINIIRNLLKRKEVETRK